MPVNRRIASIVPLFLVAVVSALAQTTLATITGTVTDSTGAALPNATVTALHVHTGFKHTAQTNEVGLYTLSQLREGTYEVRFAAQGSARPYSAT